MELLPALQHDIMQEGGDLEKKRHENPPRSFPVNAE